MIDHRAVYWFDLSLIWPLRLDRQGVDIGLEQVCKGLMNHPMTLNSATPRKRRRHNPDREMPLPIPRTGVAGMQVALILDQQVDGRKRSRESCLDPVDTLATHGSTSLNGLTVTWA
jgi:hypothetical protein